MKKGMTKEETVSLFDRIKNLYVRVQLSDNKKYYERWVSRTKRKWVLDKTRMTLDDVMKSQQDIVNNNYRNLFNIVTKK